ncbi:MAG: HupE/UreJ family protein [Bacteroidia bacterium]
MADFFFLLEMGFFHVLSIEGIDHMLYVMLLTFSLPFTEWKKLIWIMTGFTAGHTISLFYGVLNVLPISIPFLEFLVALSILVTSVIAYRLNQLPNNRKFIPQLVLAGFFGLIHGAAFGNSLIELLSDGSFPIIEVLGFNFGIELAQVLIFLLTIGILFFVKKRFQSFHELFVKSTILLIGIYAVYLSIDRLILAFS